MSNRDARVAQDYHQATKLAYINLGNKPPLYKKYSGVPAISLPTDFPAPNVPTLGAVVGSFEGSAGVRPSESAGMDINALARLLFYSAGVIHRRVLPMAGEVHYRAAASAGALYPVEVYLVAGDLPGLEAGVYHFASADFTLGQLRRGDYRSQLLGATSGDRDIAAAPLILVFTSVFWRSAWKYRVRSYRYGFWDTGTILANLLAVIRGEEGLKPKVLAGFVDHQVDQLLGLQSDVEGSLCLVSIGTGDDVLKPANAPDLPSLEAESSEGTAGQIDYPEIQQLHASSSLASETEVLAWRSGPAGDAPPMETVNKITGPQGVSGAVPQAASALTIPKSYLESLPLGETVRGRGSTRRYARSPISYSQFAAILDSSTREIPADFVAAEGGNLLDLYIVVNAVEDLSPGAYYFSPRQRRLELLKQGEFREEAGHLCFEQALGADASAVVFLMADLERLLGRFGNRGYRAAQMEAGIVVGNIYLSAHSLGLGASGLTFYDDDVTDFFSPHAAGKSVMFLSTLGVVHSSNRVLPFRSRVGVLLDSLARGAGGASPSVEK